MLIDRPFLKLPRQFDAATLAAEVEALPASAWVAHPTNYEANDAVLLVTPGGESVHSFAGAMAATEHLKRCPYIMEVMAELGGPWGRSRLMGLEAGGRVPMHIDTNYHWRTHVRIHIPLLTNPNVKFTCDGETVHMGPGECWTFDSFLSHTVVNDGPTKRVHLVLDTVGSGPLWDLVEQAKAAPDATPAMHEPGDSAGRELRFEQHNVPKIMSPWEMRCHINYVRQQIAPSPIVAQVFAELDRFVSGWGGAWAQYETSADGIPAYQQLIVEAQQGLKRIGGGQLKISNGLPLYGVLTALIFRMAVPEPRHLAA
jgi:hypothetical protein